MPVTNYYTVNGELIGEKTSGGSRTDYLTDALGSVVATVSPSAQVVNTYRYKPYGAQLAKTGAGADPAFRWVGSLGYRQTGKAWSDVYVRARHYDTAAGRWTSKDPIRFHPWRGTYGYAGEAPGAAADTTGLSHCDPPQCCYEQLAWLRGTGLESCKRGDGSYGTWGSCQYHGSDARDECRRRATCAGIKAYLRFAALLCRRMCRRIAIPGGGSYYPGEQADKVALCCAPPDEHVTCGIWCCNRGIYGPPTQDQACADYCLMEHEEQHHRQCRGHVPPRVPNPSAWAECDAYRVSVLCLLDIALARGCRLEPDLRYLVFTDCLKGAVKL